MQSPEGITCAVIGPNAVRITLANGVYVTICADSVCSTNEHAGSLRIAGWTEPVETDAVDGRDARDDRMDMVEAWAADAARRGLSRRYIEQQRARVGNLYGFVGNSVTKVTGGQTAFERPLQAKKPHAKRPLVTREQVRAWLAHLSEHGMPHPHRPAQPCSPKTLNNHLSAVRKFFRWAIKAGLIDHDPTEGIEWARVRTNKGRVLSGLQAWAIFEAAQQDESAGRPRCRDKRGRVIVRSPFYRVLIATGMRAGAAEGLRVRDFLLTAEPPRIVVRADTAKNRAEQEIIISDADRRYFAEVLSGLHPNDRALTRPHYRVLQADARAAGVPVRDDRDRGVGFHCFRRWHGTEMDRQGFSLEQIRQRLGHKTHLSTMGYLVRELEEQQGVAETLAKMSPKSLDEGNRNADDLNATNGSPPSRTKDIGEKPVPAVCRKTNGAGPPLSFDHQPPGLSGRFSRQGQQAKGRGREWAQQDSNLSPNPDDNRKDRLSLLHRIVDLLERESPGRKAEGHEREQDE